MNFAASAPLGSSPTIKVSCTGPVLRTCALEEWRNVYCYIIIKPNNKKPKKYLVGSKNFVTKVRTRRWHWPA